MNTVSMPVTGPDGEIKFKEIPISDMTAEPAFPFALANKSE